MNVATALVIDIFHGPTDIKKLNGWTLCILLLQPAQCCLVSHKTV